METIYHRRRTLKAVYQMIPFNQLIKSIQDTLPSKTEVLSYGLYYTNKQNSILESC